jgi:putative transposase
MKNTQVARLLAYVTGLVNQQLLLQNEYLIAENRILRSHLPARVPLTNAQRATLSEIARGWGGGRSNRSLQWPNQRPSWLGIANSLLANSMVLNAEPTRVGPPLVARSRNWSSGWRARTAGWGYDRIAGALKNLGHNVSDQTVGNILQRFGVAPVPKRRQQTTWAEFIRSHLAVLAGIDFLTVEVLSSRGLTTYYILFFLHLETRRVTLAGITQHPTEEWMVQMARNAVDDIDGALLGTRFALHDRDTKFCSSFQTMLQFSGVQPILLPRCSPNLNAFAERWVRSIKEECLSKLILFGEASLRRTATEFTKHYHHERNHQGKENRLLFPISASRRSRPNLRL